MVKKNCLVLLAAILCLFCVVRSEKAHAKDKKLKPEELVAEHLKSIGSPELLAKIKSRQFSGFTSVRFILGASGQLVGQSHFASEGNKLGIFMRFDSFEYPKEHFAFDGKDVTVSYMKPGARSPLGSFVDLYGGLMKEGLMGGSLSAGWSLLDIQERRPRLKADTRKIEGRQLHELDYRPRKSIGDVQVKLYFDNDTFRHVRTEYRLRIKAGMGANPGEIPDQRVNADYIYLLLEQFDDFKEVDGMTLPHKYTIDFSVEGQGDTFLAQWTMEASKWIHNGLVDPQFFDAE